MIQAGAHQALAESPVIAEQQLKYRAAKKRWEQKRLPSGLAAARAFARQEKSPTSRASGIGRTVMLLNNVDYQLAGGIGYSIKQLVLSMEPKKAGAPVDLDKVDSFIIRLHRGEVVMHSSTLSALFNEHVLDYPGKPLAGMKMKIAGGRLSAENTLVLCSLLSDFGIPTSLSGTVSLTPGNKLAFKIDKLDGMGIPLADVMKSLGLTLPTVANIERPGVAMKGFTIELDHRKMFPFPELAGNIASARLASDGLHIVFGDAPRAKLNPPAFLKNSYIWIQSGDLKFYGAVVMNARIAMIPRDPRKRLRFDLYGYRKQLATGEAKLDKDGMMVVRIP
jgi:hypothetical protein